ncbi:FAD-binding domain-containing protein [Pilatotrama ljubarskyi]|nr:FAD-binding domain-containing protein [Pilatotrama ljubarskyi]
MGAHTSHLLPPATHSGALDALNATLGGRVQVAVPFARPCFPLASPDVFGQADSAACAQVVQSYLQSDLITSDFGAYENTAGTICQATGEQCLLDSSNPNDTQAFLPPNKCEQGNLPSYFIDVRGPQDVIAAFDFSRKTGVPLSIKNTGHDYASRSTGAGTLALWTHNLQGTSYNKSFVPTGCKNAGVPAVTFGTGVLLGDLFRFADTQNITILGAADSSIAGGGGYVLGGGHSAFSNALGLAVDQVLEFEVVTPDGQHRFANACSHPDLFFALRGGGGGTFGVVLRVTMKALPQLTTPVIRTGFSSPPSIEVQTKYIEFLIDHALPLASKGWGGYIKARPHPSRSPLRANTFALRIQPDLGLTFVNPLATMAEAAETMADLQQFVETQLNGTGLFFLAETTSYLSFYNQFVANTTLPNDAPAALASRLIPASVFNSSTLRTQLLDAVMTASQRHTITLLFSVAPFFFKDDGLTSVSPAWRESLWHIIYIDYWAYNTTVSQRAQIYEGLEADARALRKIAPDSGVYWNEASVFEPDYQQAFWGSHYGRLVGIKRKYDPDHLLDCWKCVDWRGASNERYKCQPKL